MTDSPELPGPLLLQDSPDDAPNPELEAGPGDPSRSLRVQVTRRSVTERRRVTQRLRQALNGNGLVLHFQPQFNLKSEQLRGAEAMIRLTHRRRGLIPPSHFMPVAERSDIIHDIGGWMLHAACIEAMKWPAALIVSISLSPRQLRSGRLVKSLIEALSLSGLPAERLELELTEAILIDNSDDMVFSLEALRGLGVRMAINDFGTGYASLSALQRLPLQTLKLARILIQELETTAHNPSILHAAVDAGHALGCTVMADGVETNGQCALLRQIGCDEGQGPFFGTPIPAEELHLVMQRG